MAQTHRQFSAKAVRRTLYVLAVITGVGLIGAIVAKVVERRQINDASACLNSLALSSSAYCGECSGIRVVSRDAWPNTHSWEHNDAWHGWNCGVENSLSESMRDVLPEKYHMWWDYPTWYYLANRELTAEAVDRLSRLETLEALDLGCTNMTDHMLARLTTLTEMRRLEINCTHVTSASVDVIASFPHLEIVALPQDAFEADDIRRLQELKPGLRIVEGNPPFGVVPAPPW